MDREWMRTRLLEYRTLLDTYDVEVERSDSLASPELDVLVSQINGAIPTAREIVKRLDPRQATHITVPLYIEGTSAARGAVEQALGILRDQDDWKTKLAPDAPSIVADRFHPNVWTAASAIWDTGQYRVSVQQAAVSLSAHIARKSGSSLADRELVTQVFAPPEPPKGQSRLHFPGDKTNKTWKSRQDGLHQLAQGAFAGIRNIATHTNDEWTEQVALEHRPCCLSWHGGPTRPSESFTSSITASDARHRRHPAMWQTAP